MGTVFKEGQQSIVQERKFSVASGHTNPNKENEGLEGIRGKSRVKNPEANLN